MELTIHPFTVLRLKEHLDTFMCVCLYGYTLCVYTVMGVVEAEGRKVIIRRSAAHASAGSSMLFYYYHSVRKHFKMEVSE